MRMRAAVVLLPFASLTPACFDGDPNTPFAAESSGDAADTTTGSNMADTMLPGDADSGTTAEPADGTTTMSMVDPTEGVDSSTTEDSAESTTTTDDGGCDPGVFGVSQFGDACFQ